MNNEIRRSTLGVLWSAGNRPTQVLLGLSTKELLKHLKALYLLSEQIFAAGSFYFESSPTREATQHLRSLFERGDILYFIDASYSSFYEHGLRKIEKSPASFSAYEDIRTVQEHGRELDSIGHIFRRPSCSISERIVELWINEIQSRTPGTIGAALSTLSLEETDRIRLEIELMRIARYREKDFVWEYVQPKLVQLRIPQKYQGVIRSRLVDMYSKVTAELLRVSVDQSEWGSMGNQLVGKQSRYDTGLFLKCMDVLGVRQSVSDLEANELAVLKRSPEFVFFKEFYIALIEAMAFDQENVCRLLPIYRETEKAIPLALVGNTAGKLVRQFTGYVKKIGQYRKEYRRPLDMLLGTYELFKRLPIDDLITRVAATRGHKDKIHVGGKMKKAFIVHGHDDAAKYELAHHLRQEFNLEPVILHEQPNYGTMTIIDKFERFAMVCDVAFVLLTPDDKVVDPNANNTREVLLRARQNVIFELGYSIAKLGRDRVIVLHKGNVEIPSDMAGIVYIPFEKIETIHLQLQRELKAMGLI